jgi:hypothetical protein
MVAYDTCGNSSPIRNCVAGEALFVGVILTHLGIPVVDSVDASKELRDGLRSVLMVEPGAGYATDGLMFRSMKATLKEFFASLKGDTREKKLANMWTGKSFMLDVAPGGVGTHIYRDPALEILRKSWGSGGLPLTETEGWDAVRFPVIFHLQWTNELSPSGKVKMLFHTTFDPWRTAVALAMMLCGPNPPIQVRETPYKDGKSMHQYQSPRKYVIDFDLYVEENLGKAAPMSSLTEPFLFDLFVRSLAVIHTYMRRGGVLPGNRKLCISIKSRTRRAKNKAGRMDTKCSYHATVHIMEPAERHRTVITKVLDMVRRDKISAFRAMTEKDGLRRGIESPGRWVCKTFIFTPVPCSSACPPRTSRGSHPSLHARAR